MQARHLDRKRYFDEQALTTKLYVIPYINSVLSINKNVKVLEVGCGEGGNMLPFVQLGCKVVGVDLNETQINNAHNYFKKEAPHNLPEIHLKDIYNITTSEIGKFDLIILRDVIEHIHSQDKFLEYIKDFLLPEGVIFLGFPPWYMPFGGHQQVIDHKFLSNLPYYHILPKPVYGFILKIFGRSHAIPDLMEIKDTGISISRFKKIVAKNKYTEIKSTFWFINPNYETKFGLKQRKTWLILTKIPYLRDAVTTCYYSIIKANS